MLTKTQQSSRFGGTNFHRLHRHEVAKIIHDNRDVPKTTILGQTLRSLRATLAHIQVVKMHYFIRRSPVDRLTERTGNKVSRTRVGTVKLIERTNSRI